MRAARVHRDRIILFFFALGFVAIVCAPTSALNCEGQLLCVCALARARGPEIWVSRDLRCISRRYAVQFSGNLIFFYPLFLPYLKWFDQIITKVQRFFAILSHLQRKNFRLFELWDINWCIIAAQFHVSYVYVWTWKKLPCS